MFEANCRPGFPDSCIPASTPEPWVRPASSSPGYTLRNFGILPNRCVDFRSFRLTGPGRVAQARSGPLTMSRSWLEGLTLLTVAKAVAGRARAIIKIRRNARYFLFYLLSPFGSKSGLRSPGGSFRLQSLPVIRQCRKGIVRSP